MAKQFPHLQPFHHEFIAQQQMFFVGTAAADGRVNVSPKGLDTLKILDDSSALWLNLTGSGNESAAHVAENPRMTLMFCSFAAAPLILRLYGVARVVHPRDDGWEANYAHFPNYPGARQLFVLDIDLVQSSCGYAVPLYSYQGQRDLLPKWAEKKGQDGIAQYWQEKNQSSIDGKPTFLLTDPQP